MTRYRLLNNEELETFEEEFVNYLVVNGITADDWKVLLKDDPENAQKIVDLFSDVVFEKVMRQAKFLVIKRPAYIQSIQCNTDKMIMVALSTKDKNIDLTQVDFAKITDFTAFEIHKAEKEYIKEREKELFDLTEIGYSISNGDLFKALILTTVA